MCGSSSTTITVPFSSLTPPAFHLAAGQTPSSHPPLQNHHLCHTPASPWAFILDSGYSKESRRRGADMSKARRSLIGLGAVALASGATLGGAGAVAGAATAAGIP